MHVDYGLPYPATGLMLLSLSDGTLRSSASIGSDPVAVVVSDDGSTAFVADNDPGDVYAVSLPNLKVRWKTHTGGAPFGLLLHNGRLDVTLYDDASLDELDPATGGIVGTFATVDHPAAMTVDASRQLFVAGSGDFGTATVDGDVWIGDYKKHELFDVTRPRRVSMPGDLAPFWLSAGAGGTLLIAAEGADEDADPGAVFSYDVMTGTFTQLAVARDPDQVLSHGTSTFVAGHRESAVLRIASGATTRWATGSAPVALAPDPALGFLLVVQNSHE